MAKHTRLASAHGSTRPVKKSRRYFTTKLVRELPSPQCALKAIEVAANVYEPITTTPKAAFEVAPAVA